MPQKFSNGSLQHSSEIGGLYLMELSNESLQKFFMPLVYVIIDPQSIPKLPKIKNGKTPSYFDFVIPKIWQILKHLLLFLRQFPLA